MPKKKPTTFFLQTDYADQHKGNKMAQETQHLQLYERDEGPTTLSLDLNKLKAKNLMNQTSNAFNLGVLFLLCCFQSKIVK